MTLTPFPSTLLLPAPQTLLKRLGPSRVAFVRTLVFTNNRTMATRQYMEQEVEKWIKQSEVPPLGNGSGEEGGAV